MSRFDEIFEELYDEFLKEMQRAECKKEPEEKNEEPEGAEEEGMTFEEALEALKDGVSVRRKIWDELDYVAKVGYTDPFLMMYTAEGAITPYFPNNIELFADDWEIYD